MDQNFNMRMADKRLRVYLPPELCASAGITPNRPVAFTVENGRIIAEHVVGMVPTSASYGYQRELALASIRSLDASTISEVREALTDRALVLAAEKKEKNV